MATIAITGVGGPVGRRLVAAFDARDGVERIVGLDPDPPRDLGSSKLTLLPVDGHDAQLGAALAGVDVLVHLAPEARRGRRDIAIARDDVEATRTLFEAAYAAGVRRLVHCSSVTVYGAHPENDLPLTEDSVLRGNPGLGSADRARQVEAWLWPWTSTREGLEVAVLRPAFVLGPGVDTTVTRILESPRITTVRGHRPPLQFLYVDDLVDAIVHAVDRRLTGAFNVAAEGWLSFDEVAAIVGRRTIDLPEEVAFTATDRLWRLGLTSQPPAMLHYLMHPCVMTSARLVVTGWHPRHSNRDALATSVAEHAHLVSLGPVRVERAWFRGAVVAALGAVVALAGRRLRSR